MTLLLMILAAPYIAPSGTNPGTAVRQGVSMDGGATWVVECSNCAADQRVYIVDAGAPLNVNFPATQVVSAANLDVALSTRTKPSDQQHVIIDTPATTPVTGTFWQSTQPVSAAALPLPSGAATDATLSQLFDGGMLGLGRGPSGPVPVAVDPLGVQYVRAAPVAPLNPFLPRCNPVRRTGCQP